MRISSVQGATIKTNLVDSEKPTVDKEQRKKQLLKLKQGERIDRPSIDLTLDKSSPMKKKIGVRGEQMPFQSILTQSKVEHKQKKYVVRSNIASLVRKYAAFLFKEFRLDIRKQSMRFEQFL
jgi:hypothetical protein